MEVNAEIERLQRHDFGALSTFITRYQRRLFRYLVRMVNDSNITGDLFQQTWIRVMERIRQYNQDKSFESWLAALARAKKLRLRGYEVKLPPPHLGRPQFLLIITSQRKAWDRDNALPSGRQSQLS